MAGKIDAKTFTEDAEQSSSVDISQEGDATSNATREELEKLNGLLTRTLIQKLEDGEATSTDIGNAVKIVVHNRIAPKEPESYFDINKGYRLSDLDFPVKVDLEESEQ